MSEAEEKESGQPEALDVDELLADHDPEWRPKTELEEVHWEHGKRNFDQKHRHAELEGEISAQKISGEEVLRILRELVQTGVMTPLAAQKIILKLTGRDDPQKAADEVV